jgi:hypothetical protein
MENLHFSDLVQPSGDHIRSNMDPGSDNGYQEALFTLPPNRINSPDSLDKHRIYILSSDEDSIEEENPEDRNLQRSRNINISGVGMRRPSPRRKQIFVLWKVATLGLRHLNRLHRLRRTLTTTSGPVQQLPPLDRPPPQ